MNKTVWYLHHYAGAPSLGMSYRPYYLVKALNALGFSSYVIAASYHHLLYKKRLQTQSIHQEQIDGVPYLWLKTLAYSGNGIGRIANMFSYTVKIVWFANRLVEITDKPDVIIVSSTHLFHYLTARILAKRYKARLIFEVRDLWPLSLIEILGVSPKHPLIMLMSWIEKLAYREADFVVSVLPNALEYMAPRGLSPERFVYIPNGIVITTPSSLPIDNRFEALKQLKNGGKFLIAYLGAHGTPNALEQLISAMHLLQQQNRMHIHAILVGNGIEKEALQKQAAGLQNVSFWDPIEKDQVPHFLSYIDGAFIGWKALPIYRYGISPNKIFDYMLAGKPIIHAVNTVADPVQLARCGIIVAPEQPALLAGALQQLASLSQEELKTMGENGKSYVAAHHNYSILAKRYSKLFE